MGHRALVIEDDTVLAEVLTMKLKRTGHEVTVVSNQRDAYHVISRRSFDFVLLDLRLPTHAGDMNPNSQVGFDILGYIRDRFLPSELPVVVMTAYEKSSQTAVRALQGMANDYITKPFEDSPVSLEEKLKNIDYALQEDLSPLRKRHQVVFARTSVSISGIEVRSTSHTNLLRLLGTQTLMLSIAAPASEKSCMTGRELAKQLGVQEATVRQYVNRFRKWIADEYLHRSLGVVEAQEIVRNFRDWKGYGLNLEFCSVSCG